VTLLKSAVLTLFEYWTVISSRARSFASWDLLVRVGTGVGVEIVILKGYHILGALSTGLPNLGINCGKSCKSLSDKGLEANLIISGSGPRFLNKIAFFENCSPGGIIAQKHENVQKFQFLQKNTKICKNSNFYKKHENVQKFEICKFREISRNPGSAPGFGYLQIDNPQVIHNPITPCGTTI
jgi:hypothetical protein